MRFINAIVSSAVIAITSSSVLAQSTAVQWTTASGGNGHWYQYVPTALRWPEAKLAAEARNGYLACLTSAAESAFARGLGVEIAHLGGFQTPDTCEPNCGWQWLSGEPWSYTQWAPTQPDNGSGVEDVLELQLAGNWNDYEATSYRNSFIVEYSADCNADGIVDYGQILSGQLIDGNSNGIPDCCEQGLTCSPTLLHHLKFNGDLTDSVGGATGHLMNGCHIADGVLVSDGIDDFVDFDQYLIPATGSVSVAMWVHSGSGQAIHEYISQGAFGSAFYIGRDHSDVFRIGDQWKGTGVPYAPYCDVWRHMAVVIDRIRNVTEFWIDASLVASNGIAVQITSDASGQPTGIKTRLATQYCSAPCVSCCSAENFRGSMDDLRIYEGALSGPMLAEIVANREFACPGDISGNGAVDGVDLTLLLGVWGTDGTEGEFDADITNDGIVGGADLTVLFSGWGPCPN